MPTTAQLIFSNQRLLPAIKPAAALTDAVQLKASTNFTRGMILGELLGLNAKQKLAPSTGANLITGGTFTVTSNANGTGAVASAAIPAIATAAEIQAALEAMASIGAGNVLVTGGPLIDSDVFIEFRGALAYTAVANVTVGTGSLTSGGAAAVTVSSVQAGTSTASGVFAPYSETATDGSQFARAIMQYDAVTDASGNITPSATAGNTTGGEFGQTYPNIDVYFAGWFKSADLVQPGNGAGSMDGSIFSGGRFLMTRGTLANGLIRLL